MAVDIQELKKQIQDLRERMKEMSKDKALNDPKILETSQKLDELLVEYERLIMNMKER